MAKSSGGLDLRGSSQQMGRRLLRWPILAEVVSELRKVEWPTRPQVVRLSLVVIAVSAAVGVLLGLVDLIFTLLINRLWLGV